MVTPGGDSGKGQNVWQAMGGTEVGPIWGRGSHVAPDRSADGLHRECVFNWDARRTPGGHQRGMM
ncbi:hypothetical protein [Gemmata sp.]|uniref:hypothetical protein n=1 Tax=Gemmata sp. TaxID=1914242 RepID=UPI003F6E5621